MLELLKIIVQPVILERNSDGSIVGEKLGEPTSLYTSEQISEFVADLQENIAKANAEAVTS